MAKLSIEKKHQLTHKKAKEAAQRVADDLKARFELKYAWRGNAIEFERPGLTGKMEVGKDNVRLDADLGMILSLLKPKLEAEIHKEFDLRFGKTAKG
jgi:putative polyhydroxyalkanoate system protein